MRKWENRGIEFEGEEVIVKKEKEKLKRERVRK
jgi:hypothetical protein